MAEGLLADGGPTALYYANRVQQFPLALVALAAVNAVFPALKAYGHTGRLRELRRLHDRSQYAVLFLALPAAVGLLLLARPVASALFEHGSYGSAGIARIASALRVLAFAILPAGAVGLVGRAYYAMGDFKTPVRISIVMLVLNAGLNVLFVRGLGMDVDGLALATVLTAWGNLAWLWLGMGPHLGLPPSEGGMLLRVARIAAASALAGLGALGASVAAAPAGAWGRVAAGATAGFALYALAARVLRIPEWEEIGARLRRRFS
jgi:putative peptidoglycan lipid II flippase